jgi:hypothetical protein
VSQNVSQYVIPNVMSKLLNIRIVADVHDLRDDTVWHVNSLIRCFPPDVPARQMPQSVPVNLSHGSGSNIDAK